MSMKFKFIHKFVIIHEKFLVLFKLQRRPDRTCSGSGSGPRDVHPWLILKLILAVYNVYMLT